MSNHLSEIGFILVNYNSAQETARLLADLMLQDRSNCKLTVVVADNGPSQDSLASLRKEHSAESDVKFEVMPGNLGYFGAAHYALNKQWKDQLPDWVIVSNADIRLPQAEFFSRIVQLPPETGAVIAPRIVSRQTGLDQNPFHRTRPSVLRMGLNRLILRVPFLYHMLLAQSVIKNEVRKRLHRKPSTVPSHSAKIYAAHGAFIVFSREYFERGGSLDAGAFLFAEETLVAETCLRLGLQVTYQPSLEVMHDEHVSTNGNPSIRHFQVAAADYCFREFFAKPTK